MQTDLTSLAVFQLLCVGGESGFARRKRVDGVCLPHSLFSRLSSYLSSSPASTLPSTLVSSSSRAIFSNQNQLLARHGANACAEGQDGTSQVSRKPPSESNALLTRKCNSLYDDPCLSDVKVKFGGQQIHAHKVVLSTKCEYFYKAFTGGFPVCSSEVIWSASEPC